MKRRHFLVCPTCGFPVYGDTLRHLFRGKQLLIFDAVVRAGDAGIDRDRLVERVYADDPNGGAITANTSVAVMIHRHLNPRLKPYGLRVWAGQGRGRNPYRLQRL